MKMMDFADKVFNFTEESGLFSAPCHLVVGVSGGPDSMALLHCLTHWPVAGIQLSAVHINHGLRGQSAQRDEDFVRRYCAENSLPLTVFHEDIVSFAKAHKLTLEEAGRVIRYDRFEQVRDAQNADRVVTAHTASDQIETMLMHLIRGCGLDALQGIPEKRGNVCRPMLSCTRDEVLEYCRINQVPYVLDETNEDVRFTRNRIRCELLPLLRKMNPAVEESLLRFRQHSKEDISFLDDQTVRLLEKTTTETGVMAAGLQEAPQALRRRAIRLFLRQQRLKTIAQAHILSVEHIVLTGTGATLLPDGRMARVTNGVLSVQLLKEAGDSEELFLPVTEFPFCFTVSGNTYQLVLTEKEKIHNLFSNQAIDYAIIQGNLTIRSRKMGDTLRPAGRGITKSIKKLMNEWKIPQDERESYPLLCDDAGVLLVPGYACDQRAVIRDETEHCVVFLTT